MAGLGLGEGRVVEFEVDAGFEGVVEFFDAVGGEEDYAGVVFEGSEEDFFFGTGKELVSGDFEGRRGGGRGWLTGYETVAV